MLIIVVDDGHRWREGEAAGGSPERALPAPQHAVISCLSVHAPTASGGPGFQAGAIKNATVDSSLSTAVGRALLDCP